MTRGDVVVVALQGDYGKPRPALIVQSDRSFESFGVVIVPITSTIVPRIFIRIEVAPSPTNGLERHSQLMVDKIIAVPRTKVGKTIGRLTDTEMLQVDAQLALLLGLR